MRPSLPKIGRFVFHFGLAAVFFYFGILAVLHPQEQGFIWIRQSFQPLITAIIPIVVFMTLLGAAQIAVAVSLVTGVLRKYALGLAAFMLIGIIINLGFGDLAMRDFAILTGVLYLLAQEWS